jgi:hypothetical protein
MNYLPEKWLTGNVACCLGQEEKISESRVMAGGQKNVQMAECIAFLLGLLDTINVLCRTNNVYECNYIWM